MITTLLIITGFFLGSGIILSEWELRRERKRKREELSSRVRRLKRY